MPEMNAAIYFSRALVAICICIGAMEYLAIRNQFTGAGVFSDSIHVLNWTRGPRIWVAACRVTFSYRGALIVHSLRLLLSLTLLFPIGDPVCALVLALLAILQLHTFHFSGVGHDGSDQMTMVLLPSLAVAYSVHLHGPCAWVALWFVTIQAMLAYATSGISKLVSPLWRSGLAIRLIFNTASYGAHGISKLLTRMPALAIVLAWSVILSESVMPIALTAPQAAVVPMLFLALTFHAATAVTMGLNCFVWAFAAALPLVYVCTSFTPPLPYLFGTGADRMGVLAGFALATLFTASVLIRYYEVVPSGSLKTTNPA
jgi:hypothetical protein